MYALTVTCNDQTDKPSFPQSSAADEYLQKGNEEAFADTCRLTKG